MARAHSSGPAFIRDNDADLFEIETWYRQFLADTLPPVDTKWEPVKLGPTWQYDPNDGWLLPDASLGWGFLAWCGLYLRGKGGKPWQFTAEQARFLLWYYSVDSDGDARVRVGRLQRLKGWGKDPLAATVAAGSLHAPIIFDCWQGDRPIGRDDDTAWTQILAVKEDQTKNTFKLFPSLIPQETRNRFGIQIGKVNVWSDGDSRQIEAIAQNVDSVEGGRPKQIIRAEIQNWVSGNGGHDMAGAVEGNAAKAEEGQAARILDIFNAYVPGRDSVAERARINYDELVAQGGQEALDAIGVIWDSLEAPPDAPLNAKDAPDVLRAIRGDAAWLDIRPKGTIVASIMDPDNSPSESRRKWYNQITGTEDAWVDPRWVDANKVDDRLVDGDAIVLFGDGSKSGDDTGLMAVRLSDGLAQTLHWQHPVKGDLVDRAELDAAVSAAFGTYKVRAFWFDPSHAKSGDAVEEDRFWWPLVDDWHRRYSRRLPKKWWATPKHSVAFDMTTVPAQKLFQPAVTQAAEDLHSKVLDSEAEGAPHHGGKQLVLHMKAARRREGRFGVSIGKENRSSTRKIDLAVCFIGARMLWRHVRLSTTATPGRGRAIILQ